MKKIFFVGLASIVISIVGLSQLFAGGISSKKGNDIKDARIVSVALTGSPNTLDPQATSETLTAQVNRSIYDTLLFPPKGHAGLAESWDVSLDTLTLTINLRKGVYFHHGKELKAEDVIATFERMRNPDTSAPFAEELALIKEMRSNAEGYQLEIVLKQYDANMPLIFASSHMAILPADLIAEGHDFSQKPVGTGPFKFVSWEQGIKIVLEVNEDYFLGAPALDGVVFYILTDVSVQMQALKRGEIDVMPYVIEPELSAIDKNISGVSVHSYPGSTILLLAMNTAHPLLQSYEFRKAIAQAIDKDKVINIAYPNSNKINVFWHSDSDFFVEVPEVYDKAAAKAFFASKSEQLAEETLTITVPSNFSPHVRAAVVYQSLLKEVGLEVEIAQVSWASWISDVYRKSLFDITVIGHTGKMTPFQRLRAFKDTGGYVAWQNKEFLALMEEVAHETDREKQIEWYHRIFTEMTQDYPFVFVAESSVNIAIRDNLQSILFDPVLETYDFREATFK